MAQSISSATVQNEPLASSSRTTVLKLPNTLITSNGMLHLLLDPLGSRNTFRTGAIMVNGGQQVRLLIENELRLSTWTVH